MTGGNRNEALDRRVEEVRRLMRDRRAAIEPGPFFVDRVIARLPAVAQPTLAWAARRVLPVTLALAAVLSVAVLVTSGSASRSASPAASQSPQYGTDPLEWLLENGRGVR